MIRMALAAGGIACRVEPTNRVAMVLEKTIWFILMLHIDYQLTVIVIQILLNLKWQI